jgi:hypothetical protein
LALLAVEVIWMTAASFPGILAAEEILESNLIWSEMS